MKIASMFKGVIGIGAVVVVAILIFMSGSLIEMVDNNEYVIHQSAIDRDMNVWNDAGMNWQLFGTVEHYRKQGAINLSSQKTDGGDGKFNQAVTVQFPDGHATIDITARYQLSLTEKHQTALYKNIGVESSVREFIRQQIIEGVKQVGNKMTSADAYADRRPEIAIIARDQILKGIFAAEITERETGKDKDGNPILVKEYDVKTINGQPVITKTSALKEYGISLPQFNLKSMKFDDKTIALIEAKKNAKRAQQDAITAYEEGQAKVAQKKAEQEAIKIEAVTIAQKEKDVAVLDAQREKEVATLNAEKAKQEKKTAVLLAQAKKAELDIADGLSERVKYVVDKQTEATIESAKHFAQWKGPEIVINGGGSGKGGSNLGDALMLNQYMSILEKKKSRITGAQD